GAGYERHAEQSSRRGGGQRRESLHRGHHQFSDPEGEHLISTVAGTGMADFSRDGGPATQTRLNAPTGLALDAARNLYVADNLNHRIRRVSAPPPPPPAVTEVVNGATNHLLSIPIPGWPSRGRILRLSPTPGTTRS